MLNALLTPFNKYLPVVALLLLALSVFLGTQVLSLNREIGRVTEECNTRMVEGAREAIELVREEESKAYAEQIRELNNEMFLNRRMMEDYQKKYAERQGALVEAQRKLREAINASSDNCAGAGVPIDLWMHIPKPVAGYGIRGEAGASADKGESAGRIPSTGSL